MVGTWRRPHLGKIGPRSAPWFHMAWRTRVQDARAAHVQTVHTPVSTETAPASWRQARGAIPGTQCVYWPTIHTLPPTSFRPRGARGACARYPLNDSFELVD